MPFFNQTAPQGFPNKIKDSRFIGIIDVPEVKDLDGRFVYNFFVPDERVKAETTARFQGGMKSAGVGALGQPTFIDNTQKAIDTSVIRSEVPRFVELDFSSVTLKNATNIEDFSIGSPGFLEANDASINSEETITSIKDVSVVSREAALRKKLKNKLALFSFLKGADPKDPKDVISLFKSNPKIDSSIVEDLMSRYAEPGLSYVNQINELKEIIRFTAASKLYLHSFVDRRHGKNVFDNLFSKKIENIPIVDKFTKDNKQNKNIFGDDNVPDSFEPSLVTIKAEKVSKPSNAVSMCVVGYIIERRTLTDKGLFEADTADLSYLDGKDTTKFFDTNVIYDETYSYSVRTVVLVEMTIEQDEDQSGDLDAGFYKIRSLISSRTGNVKTLTCVENRPPKEPDGVFYRYNYDKGTGMIITWQIPIDKQQDVKYFQVFRRRHIKEPYTCIAEIDFDDSELKTERTEKVRPDRIYEYKFPRMFFNDVRFDRHSKFIYAISAVDAHGLTSGYSAQTEVGFNRNKNEIMLNTISRAGAPKQYPNFFIDPNLDDNVAVDSLTSDAMMSSHKQKVYVYFDPDARVVKNIADGKSKFETIVKSKNVGDATYVLNLINVDRQKSVNIKFEIQDTRNTGNPTIQPAKFLKGFWEMK
jgi:hypothetical protein